MTELWKSCPGFQNYEVSSFGRVRRCVPPIKGPSYLGKILKLVLKPSGYLQISLCSGAPPYQISAKRVNRLVCEAFHGPAPSPEYEAAHWNGIKIDNRAENLRWALPKENQDDMRRHGTRQRIRRAYISSAKLSDENVLAIRTLLSAGVKSRHLAEAHGVSRSTINRIRSGKAWVDSIGESQ